VSRADAAVVILVNGSIESGPGGRCVTLEACELLFEERQNRRLRNRKSVMISARNRNPPTAPPVMAAIGVGFAVELVLNGCGNTVTVLTPEIVPVAMEGAIDATVITRPFVSVVVSLPVDADGIPVVVGVEGALAEVNIEDI